MRPVSIVQLSDKTKSVKTDQREVKGVGKQKFQWCFDTARDVSSHAFSCRAKLDISLGLEPVYDDNSRRQPPNYFSSQK